MAGLLRRDPTGRFDAVGKAGTSPAVLFRSSDAANFAVTAATLNGANAPVEDDRIVLPALERGSNALFITVVGPSVGDGVKLLEDRGGGKHTELKRRSVGAGLDGINPVLGFVIHAS